MAVLTTSLFAQNASPSSSDNDEVLLLKPFSVTAEKSTGYKVTSASTATRTNTPLIDIPQTVDIVTKEFWEDMGATSFDQSFKYVANVFVRNRHAGSGDNVNLRGFETSGSISVDGVRMGNNKRDLVGYERLEVVKGPPSAVQGRAGGTGLLNFILKKPDLGSSNGSIKYSLSFDEYDSVVNRVEFDANYSPKSQPNIAVRVAGAWNEGDDYIQYQKIKNYSLYPSFKWQITPRTELIVANELLDLNTPNREEGHGFAVYPSKLRRLIPLFDNPNDPITALNLPYDFNVVGPGSQEKAKVASSTLFFTHQFNDWLYFRQIGNIRYFSSNSFTYTGEDNTKTSVNSQLTGSIGSRRGTTAQGDLIAKYDFRKWFTGMTMVGYSYNDGSSQNEGFSGIPNAPFNLLDMVAMKAAGFDSSFYNGRSTALTRGSYTENDSYSVGYFVQQDFGLLNDRLLLTGGLRSDHDVTQTRNAITGAPTASANTTLNSYRYGATFKLRPQLGLYIVKSVQNDATRTIQRYNGLLAGDPRLSEFFTVSPLTELNEIGVKGEAFQGRLSFTLNYWEMQRKGSVVNILSNGISQGVPVSYGTQTEIQGAQSKGWELSTYGSITDRLSIIANFTAMDTSQAFTGQRNTLGWNLTTNNPGTIPLRFTPDWNLNVFAKYSFRDANDNGWEVKAGVAAVSSLYTEVTNFGLTPIPDGQQSYDAGVSYRWKRYNFDFMVTNITEAPFYITRDQAPRTYRFSVASRF